MANSKYAYVKNFESVDNILPNTYMVVRVDGHGFHRFSEVHSFQKPNDERALKLMDAAARHVMETYGEITLAFGQSDEYSFLLPRTCTLYSRRSSKISTLFASLFASAYTFLWPSFFPDTTLKYPPSFDARIIAYPSRENVIDYFSWRQTDTHINNLYNTIFWELVLRGNLSTSDAHQALKGTSSAQKQELLFQKFTINYNTIPERFRKGSVVYRREARFEALEEKQPEAEAGSLTRETGKDKGGSSRWEIVVSHCDVISKRFWEEHDGVLSGKRRSALRGSVITRDSNEDS